jgi:two-component system chemotaxis sensor kinase CheA
MPEKISINMERHIQTFREEAGEILNRLESATLELEAEPGSRPTLDRIFRSMHTLKGSGAMFGFDDIASLAHHIETALDQARSGRLPVTRELIDLILASRDEIARILAEGGEPGREKRALIAAAVGRLLLSGEATPTPRPPERKARPAAPAAEAVYRIRIKLPPDSVRRGLDPLALLAELRGLGACQVSALTDSVPPLASFEADRLYLEWDVVLTTTEPLDAVKDVFIFVDDGAVEVEPIKDDPDKRLGDILVERRDVSRADIERVLSAGPLVGERLVAAGVVSPDRVKSALREQAAIRQAGIGAQETSIRVPAEKLDRLINLVGELVITRAQLTQNAAACADSRLVAPVENVERITDELRDCVLGIRMLPIGGTFETLKRLVRDLAAGLGKEIDLVIEGGETELDKTVIERIGDPLVHLVRNSVDHGIEAAEVRKAAGKPRRGTLRVSARHAGGSVTIQVEDDGRGLDRAALLAKALALGVIEKGQEPSEAEACNLIFHPGLSTAQSVSDVSGRGVGMDVVKREVVRLGGTIEVSSRAGQGTTVSMKLPLTLAIIDGLLVAVADSHYVVPLTHVRECVELSARQVAETHGRNLVRVRGEAVPYVRLRELFALAGKCPATQQVVIVEDQGQRLGLVADAIIGNSQAVIKALGGAFRQAEGVSGATILGDGTVALIIDVPGLERLARAEEAAAVAAIQGRQATASAGTA